MMSARNLLARGITPQQIAIQTGLPIRIILDIEFARYRAAILGRARPSRVDQTFRFDARYRRVVQDHFLVACSPDISDLLRSLSPADFILSLDTLV
jgi:hypothetical protein